MRLYAAFATLLVFSAPIAHADDNEASRRSLRGLNGIEVFVGTLPSEVEQNGLTKSAIQTDVELKLRQAGIPVLDPKVGSPWLDVNVNVLSDSNSAIWTWTIRVELHQDAILTRDSSIFAKDAVTWGLGMFGQIGKQNLRSLRDNIKDKVDQFINAYLAVNPKK